MSARQAVGGFLVGAVVALGAWALQPDTVPCQGTTITRSVTDQDGCGLQRGQHLDLTMPNTVEDWQAEAWCDGMGGIYAPAPWRICQDVDF